MGSTDTEEGWLQLAETAKRWSEVRGLLLVSGMLLPVIDSWLVIHHKQTAGVVPPAAAVCAAAVPLLSTGWRSVAFISWSPDLSLR